MNAIDYRLMFVTDDRIKDDTLFFKILEASLKGGTTIVQLREKQLHTKLFYHRAQQAKSICETYNVPLIINDRVDIALAINADGVHLGQNDMPVNIARKLLGENKIIGLSVSNIQQAEASNRLNINYIGISPIFSTNTKTKDLDKPMGISGLKNIRKISNNPIVCIGGVDEKNVSEIIKNGANGIAVVSAISKAKNPENAAKYLKQLL
ncbi:thiamine-phosphate pyrophosphorylase [Tamlana sedimentorum]|uniref:Thiamine-phosphate synthase n=1 Tax=Neotamlana sedimentorum TaxID=1435349 RepID=A0A0D7WB83_9FLAO|nr:thiamine phosphate synthase [Tamlana sedimentorum]KJD35948.1 thiamine-phosphate pyrophosphorylase [Tamlana sedimentorum]